MPADFHRSPKLLKGGLVVFPSQVAGPPPQVIVFQYNPEQTSRNLASRAAPQEGGSVGGAQEDVLRILGPPTETINLSVVLDATDQLAEPQQNRATVENGLHPTLAVLDLLLYPSTARFQKIQDQAQKGNIQICPADLPLTLLVWGKSRVVPVLLTSFSVTEEEFDQNLNPIRAKVDLGMKVLTYMELKQTNKGFDVFLAYQKQKEALAKLYQAGANESRVRGLLSL